jgi:molecular chaperone DnaK (HSP70)
LGAKALIEKFRLERIPGRVLTCIENFAKIDRHFSYTNPSLFHTIHIAKHTNPPNMSEEAAPAERVAIGISFGNSYSSIAFTSPVCARPMEPFTRRSLTSRRREKRRLSPTKTEVCCHIFVFRFLNSDLTPPPDRQIPSILSYVEGEELHAGQAKSQLIRNSKNTVAYFRDFLGQEYASLNTCIHPVLMSSQI